MAEDRMSAEVDQINSQFTAEYPTEVSIKADESAVIRILDGSNSFTWDLVSWFLCDDDKIRPFIVENEIEGKGLLSRMLGDPSDFCKGGYLQSTKGQFGKVFTYQAENPELFKRVNEYYNPGLGGTATARPRKEYVYNVLHRNPEMVEGQSMLWCVARKHTKLLKIGQKAFALLKQVRSNDGEFWDYDINYSKTRNGKDTVTSFQKAGNAVLHVTVGPVTSEEREYEKYDLGYVTRLSSARYISQYLRNTIIGIGNVMGVNWVDELDKQFAIEQEAYNNNQGSTGNVYSSAGVSQPSAHVAQQTSPQQVQPPIPAQPVQSRVPIQPAVIQQPVMPQQNVQPTPMPTQVQHSGTVIPAGNNIPQGQPMYSGMVPPASIPNPQVQNLGVHPVTPFVQQEAVATVVCPGCNTPVSADAENCTLCGTALKEPCAICNYMMAVGSTVCPNCNTQYSITT
jgi:hypothetical protein